MKNVLLLLHDDQGENARLKAAVDLTKAIGGHLHCLDVLNPAEVLDRHLVTIDAVMLENVREQVSQHRKLIEQRLGTETVSWRYSQALGSPATGVIDAAELADIVVLSLPGTSARRETKHLIGDVAIKVHRPILAVPQNSCGLDVSGKALVAWSGSHQSAEALRSAVPLLQYASSVVLYSVNSPISRVSIKEATAYLSKYKIPVEVVQESTTEPVSEAILDKAQAIQASYVVAGAYGLPRWLESSFGGVTDGLVERADMPILLAH